MADTPGPGNPQTTGPGAVLSLKHVFGLSSDVASNIRFLDESVFLYPAGNQIVIYNVETRSQRFIHGTEATSAVAVASGESGISAIATAPKDRKYVAIAERGERASVSVFNVHTLKRTRASLVSSECGSKQFVSMSFSSDQRYLLTQGGPPDYALINWLWEKSRPLQSVKLATGVNVRITAASFLPSDPSVVVVIGSNLIRILRCEGNEFKPIPLALKAKKESMEFQCMAWDGDRCLVGADNGEIFVLDALEHRRTYCTPKEANAIHSIAVYSKGFVCGCDDGLLHIFERVDDKSSHTDNVNNTDLRTEGEKEWYRPYKTFRISESVNRVINLDVSPTGETLVCSLDNSQAYTLNLSQIDIFKPDDMNFELVAQEFHSAAVTALDVCTRKPLIATCSFDCSVRIWNYDDNTNAIVKQFEEAPLSLAFHPSGLILLVGFADRLTLMSVLMDGLKPFKDFPIKDCRECAFSNGGQYFAAASGTTIAVYTTYTAESVVNLRGHTGKIRSIAWNADDSGLVSGGVNGIIIEWDLASGNRLQEFEQKNCTITSVAIAPDRHIYAVGNDSVLRELFQGSVKASFDLNVVMTRLTIKSSGGSRMLFLGGSTGSVRVFRLPLTNSFQSYSIHSGAITSIKVSPDETMLFAASEDGSVSVLEIRDGKNGASLKREKRELPWAEEVLVSKADLEERVQLAKELNDKVEELTIHNDYQTKLKELNFQEQIRALHDKYNNELKAEKQKLAMLEEEKSALGIRYSQALRELKARDEKSMQEFAVSQEKRLKAEKERYRELQAAFAVQRQQRERELIQREKANKQDLAEMDEEYQAQLEATRAKAIKIEKEKLEIIEEFEETKGVVEKDADQEIDELKESYDAKLAIERKQTLSLSGNNGVLKAKFAKMQSRIKKQKEHIEAMVEDERKLYEVIRGLEKDIEGYQKEITERGSTIADKDKRINDLRKKNQELEKFKFVLDYKIRELNRQIEPREKEIERRKKQLEEMDSEIRRYRAEFGILSLNVKELKLRLAGMTSELQQQRDRNNTMQDSISTFNSALQSLAEHGNDAKRVKKMLVALYQHYQDDKILTTASTTSDINKEHERQRSYLEKMIKSLQRKHAKDVQIHKKANLRIMADNADLITEINELRRDIDFCEKQIARQQNDGHRKLIQQEKKITALQAKLSAMTAKSKGPRSAPVDEFTPRIAKETI